MSEETQKILESARALREKIGREHPGTSGGALMSAAMAIEQAAEQLAAREEAVEKNASSGDRFIANLSHELRTPLTPALLLVSALQGDSSIPESARSDLAMVREQLDLEARLVDDLLDNSRLSRGRLQLRREPLDLNALLGGIIATKLAQVSGGPSLTLEYRSLRQRVQGDAARLRQIMSNLLDNAFKYTPASGNVEVITLDAGNRIVIEVRDNGRGFDATQGARIFEAFDHGREELARNFGGLGLGLSIARGLAQLHGGDLNAESAGTGKGAIFRLFLQAMVEAPTLTAAEHHRTCILLVEDDAQSRLASARLLEYLGYVVRMSGSFKGALQILHAEKIDVLLCDIQLPDGDGWDLMRCAREILPRLRGLALSGFGREEDVRKSLECGYDEHLIKPFTMQMLTMAIDRAVGKKNGEK